jgi:serine/threonine protein kinase
VEPGDVVGERFRIERLIGSGGMGAVFLAADRADGDRRVALKVLNSAGDASARARFVRETKILSRLRHDAIVGFVAAGFTARGAPFLAMEWLEGDDLAKRVRTSPLPLRDTLLVACRVASALAAAHRRDLVHRDVKPSNILLPGGHPGAAKLVDFGVARPGEASLLLTEPGAAVGTLGYISPEELRGERIDARADLFSLGCVLFECVAGFPPFMSNNAAMLVNQVLSAPAPRLREAVPDVGDVLDALVASLLEKDPERRPSDADSVAARLGTLSEVG